MIWTSQWVFRHNHGVDHKLFQLTLLPIRFHLAHVVVHGVFWPTMLRLRLADQSRFLVQWYFTLLRKILYTSIYECMEICPIISIFSKWNVKIYCFFYRFALPLEVNLHGIKHLLHQGAAECWGWYRDSLCLPHPDHVVGHGAFQLIMLCLVYLSRFVIQ